MSGEQLSLCLILDSRAIAATRANFFLWSTYLRATRTRTPDTSNFKEQRIVGEQATA